MSLYYLHQGFFAYLGAHDVAVAGVAGKGSEHEWLRPEGVRTVVVPFSRRPSPVLDALCLLRLWWFLLWNRFDVMHVSTPKAALIGSLAARLSGHRRVVFTLRGRVYENATGWKRQAMAQMDQLVCSLASAVVPICRELGTALVAEGLCRPEKIRTIGSGSSNGIDARHFHRTEATVAARYGVMVPLLIVRWWWRARTPESLWAMLRGMQAFRLRGTGAFGPNAA
jgi:hypothetical protein